MDTSGNSDQDESFTDIGDYLSSLIIDGSEIGRISDRNQLEYSIIRWKNYFYEQLIYNHTQLVKIFHNDPKVLDSVLLKNPQQIPTVIGRMILNDLMENYSDINNQKSSSVDVFDSRELKLLEESWNQIKNDKSTLFKFTSKMYSEMFIQGGRPFRLLGRENFSLKKQAKKLVQSLDVVVRVAHTNQQQQSFIDMSIIHTHRLYTVSEEDYENFTKSICVALKLIVGMDKNVTCIWKRALDSHVKCMLEIQHEDGGGDVFLFKFDCLVRQTVVVVERRKTNSGNFEWIPIQVGFNDQSMFLLNNVVFEDRNKPIAQQTTNTTKKNYHTKERSMESNNYSCL